MYATMPLVGSGTFVERQRHLSFLPFLVLDRVGALLIIAPVVPSSGCLSGTEPPGWVALSVSWGLCTTRGTTWGRRACSWGKRRRAGGERVDGVLVRPDG